MSTPCNAQSYRFGLLQSEMGRWYFICLDRSFQAIKSAQREESLPASLFAFLPRVDRMNGDVQRLGVEAAERLG